MTELVRYEAARRALAEAVAIDELLGIPDQADAMRHAARIAGDKGLEINCAQLRFRAERRLGELIKAQKQTVGLNRGRAGAGRPSLGGSDSEQPKSDDRPTLAEAGIDRKLSSRAQRMAELPAETFETRLKQHAAEMQSGQGRIAMDLLKVNAELEAREARRQLAADLSTASIALPAGRKYPVIYADPPWHRKQGVTNRSYENHYPTMGWDQICALPVAELVLPDAWLFLWIPRAHLLAWHVVELPDLETGELRRQKMPLASAVALAWGFEAYSTAFVWTKNDDEHPDEAGGGIVVRDQDELLLMFRRGRGLPKPASDEKFGSNHRERSRLLGHSTKPQHYRLMIATMAGRGVPVLEMFARFDADNPAPAGWDLWGNQASPSPSADEAIATGASDGAPPAPLWDHPSIVGRHVVSRARDYPQDVSFDVASCQCGWTVSAKTAERGAYQCDDAIDAHWREIIAQAAAAVPAEISEYDALKALGDFCHPRRAEICAAVGDDYAARGLAIVQGGSDQWILREAGVARLRQLEDERRAEALPPPSVARDPLDLPEFLRRDKTGQLRLGLVVPARPDIVDDHVQTRLPLNGIELEEAIAMRAIAAGADAGVEAGMVRHLVGKGWAHVTTIRVLLTDEGAAALAAWVDVAPAAQMQGATL